MPARGLAQRDRDRQRDVAALHGPAAHPRAAERGVEPPPCPKNALKRSEIDPKPSKLGEKPPDFRPSWP